MFVGNAGGFAGAGWEVFQRDSAGAGVTPKHFLDMVGDGPEDLNLSDDEIEQFSNLVKEAGALYKSRHYDRYHFLFHVER